MDEGDEKDLCIAEGLSAQHCNGSLRSPVNPAHCRLFNRLPIAVSPMYLWNPDDILVNVFLSNFADCQCRHSSGLAGYFDLFALALDLSRPKFLRLLCVVIAMVPYIAGRTIKVIAHSEVSSY
jgi:hypothetical protein